MKLSEANQTMAEEEKRRLEKEIQYFKGGLILPNYKYKISELCLFIPGNGINKIVFCNGVLICG